MAERYRSAGRMEKGRILDALCRTTGWHRKHAVRALRRRVVEKAAETHAARERKRRYGVTIKDALMALWEASDRVCGKRLVAMIPSLLPALEQHGRLQLSEGEQAQLLAVSAATIDRILGDVKVTAAGGRRRRAGFYSAIRREVPIRTFNDWKDPAPRWTLPPDGPSACRWSIVTATSSSRRSSAPRACSLGCCAVSTSTTTVRS